MTCLRGKAVTEQCRSGGAGAGVRVPQRTGSVLSRAGPTRPPPAPPGTGAARPAASGGRVVTLCGALPSRTSWRNGSASDSRSEGCVFESRRGHETFSSLCQLLPPSSHSKPRNVIVILIFFVFPYSLGSPLLFEAKRAARSRGLNGGQGIGLLL